MSNKHNRPIMNLPRNGGAGATSSPDVDRTVREADPEAVRGDRDVEDVERQQDSALLSEQEFNDLIRSEFDDVRLPNPPKIAGWHLCWLTSQSQNDPIDKRMRLGYVPVRPHELPGLQNLHAP